MERFHQVSVSQRDVLEQMFTKNAYPTRSTVSKVAEKLGLSEMKVYNWFRWKRYLARSGKYQETQSIGELLLQLAYWFQSR